MRWTIGILTIPTRLRQFETLTADLMMQRQRAHLEGELEIMVDARPDASIGDKRQRLLDGAQGDYFNFVDDDDRVARDYVSTIYPLLDGVDYIGFQVELRVNGELRPTCYHSLAYEGWSNDQNGYYRNISHLNPMRTVIARQGTFVGNYGEDRGWAAQVNPRGEHYIPRVMYHYDYCPAQSEALKRRKAEISNGL